MSRNSLIPDINKVAEELPLRIGQVHVIEPCDHEAVDGYCIHCGAMEPIDPYTDNGVSIP